MYRIIYVIPFTSIIEQNAKVFSDMLGQEYVLEHHSNYDFDANDEQQYNPKKLAAENWDIPIIVTTNGFHHTGCGQVQPGEDKGFCF